MKARKIGIVAGLTFTTLLILYLLKSAKKEKRLALVADEGYETAEDILFPIRKFSWQG